jgi:hypothetical protein
MINSPLFTAAVRGPLGMLLAFILSVSSVVRSNAPLVRMPEASGTRIEQNDWARVDLSHTDLGYAMVKYMGTPRKIRMQITHENDAPYTYDLATDGKFETFPLSGGNGKYTLNIYRNIAGDEYLYIFGTAFTATITDPLSPFLYPNQYVDFTPDSDAVALAQTLSFGVTDDLEVVTRIYAYVISNVTYDYDKLKTITSGYLPDNDATLKTKKGICFDFASLMTAMLRSQRIPTKLIIGYAGTEYHAWISVYTKETGWVEGIIRFDGTAWVRMDPTFASKNKSKTMADYIGDPKNYNALLFY